MMAAKWRDTGETDLSVGVRLIHGDDVPWAFKSASRADGTTPSQYFCTIATVGYGDFTPVTTFGRVLAVGLMLSGIGVIGVTSAAFISALTERVHRAGAGRGRVRRGS